MNRFHSFCTIQHMLGKRVAPFPSWFSSPLGRTRMVSASVSHTRCRCAHTPIAESEGVFQKRSSSPPLRYPQAKRVYPWTRISLQGHSCRRFDQRSRTRLPYRTLVDHCCNPYLPATSKTNIPSTGTAKPMGRTQPLPHSTLPTWYSALWLFAKWPPFSFLSSDRFDLASEIWLSGFMRRPPRCLRASY